jgi:hypothetical protein
MNKIRLGDYPHGNYVRCPHSFYVPPSQAGARSRLSLLRELGRSFHRRVLGNPPVPSADERFRAAVRREMAKAGLA